VIVRRRQILEAFAVVAAGLAAMAPWPPVIVERWFSTGLYPWIQRGLTRASNLAPVPWLDVVMLVALLGLGWLWWCALRTRAGEPRLGRVGRAALTTVSGAAVVYLIFLGTWGLNYRRVPLAERLVLDRAEPSTEAVVALGLEAASRLDGLYEAAHATGWHEPVWRDGGLLRGTADVQGFLGRAEPAVPARLKASMLGWLFRWNGVDAMTNPLGLEVLVNPDLLPFERPFVAAHEWAHLAGYADESEANFVGWLTCLHGGVPAEYSGWLYLYWQITAELPPAMRGRVSSVLAGGPRQDLDAIADRLRRGQLPRLRTASWLAYDVYLKANRVASGVRSYGEVVTLVLRARFEDEWRPVLAPPLSSLD